MLLSLSISHPIIESSGLLWRLFPFFIAIVAFILGWAAQQIRQESAEHANNLNDHIKDLDRLCQSSTRYWTATLNESELRAAQVELRAATFPIARFYDDEDMNVVPSMPPDRAAYLELFTAATGGDFESPNREIDPQRALEVASVAYDLIHATRKRRNRLSSFGFLWEKHVREKLKAPSRDSKTED